MEKRLRLSEKNIPQYLLTVASKEFPFELKKILRVKEVIQYTNSNYVFRADCLTSKGKKILYLKQSGRSNKKWKVLKTDPNRTVIENEKTKLLEILLGEGRVPHVLFVDYKNFILVTPDIQRKKKILIEEFAKDKVYPQLGGKFGEFFATLHGKTFDTPPVFNDTVWQKSIYQIWANWIIAGPKKYISLKIIKEFLNKSQKAKKTLIWGDPVYRNIFVDQKSFSVLDFDFTMHYDPALDNGIFLAHWVIKMLEGKNQVSEDCRRFIRQFNKSYVENIKKFNLTENEIEGIKKRTIIWTGVYMVSRTDGQSGSYYSDWPEWENKIREVGLTLIKGNKNIKADLYRKTFK